MGTVPIRSPENARDMASLGERSHKRLGVPTALSNLSFSCEQKRRPVGAGFPFIRRALYLSPPATIYSTFSGTFLVSEFSSRPKRFPFPPKATGVGPGLCGSTADTDLRTQIETGIP